MNIHKYSSYLKQILLYSGKSVITSSILCLVLASFVEHLVNVNQAFAQTSSPTLMRLNNVLNLTIYTDDQIARYAQVANENEKKRREIFRAAKSNPNWSTVDNLTESQKAKICDLASSPEFVQDLCSQLRSFTQQEAHRLGFTNQEFNQMTRDQRSNPTLQKLIQAQINLLNTK